MFTSCCYCCRSSSNKYSVESMERSREIDRALAKERRLLKRQVKVLLLGAGESGKSTFLKQMRIIHGISWSEADLIEFQHTVYSNIVQGMRVLVDARSKLQIPWGNDAHQSAADLLLASTPSPDQFTFLRLVPSIAECWGDEAIKKTYEVRHLFQLSDSVRWFFDELERVSQKDYAPSIKDILLTRRATKGLHQLSININRVPFTFYDIGGQRSQRAKWVQCFDSSLTSLIFMVAVNEFDQVLAEDRSTNRLSEAVAIFDILINNRVFKEVAIILFLNKFDLLVEKLNSGRHTLSSNFPSYTGGDSLLEAQKFILALFTEVNRAKLPIYCHWTTAVDTNKIRLIFSAVKDTILKRNLSQLMLE